MRRGRGVDRGGGTACRVPASGGSERRRKALLLSRRALSEMEG